MSIFFLFVIHLTPFGSTTYSLLRSKPPKGLPFSLRDIFFHILSPGTHRCHRNTYWSFSALPSSVSPGHLLAPINFHGNPLIPFLKCLSNPIFLASCNTQSIIFLITVCSNSTFVLNLPLGYSQEQPVLILALDVLQGNFPVLQVVDSTAHEPCISYAG